MINGEHFPSRKANPIAGQLVQKDLQLQGFFNTYLRLINLIEA
jgi:hypothetical protein